ncbi:beta-lactamase [Fusarium sporotrichioides]|uniref:Beta-lactamase n=1 Tax=Fusarium sporotrichioides TaxID=5514 RepID=A0A395RS36_FUSSP|nr:beta-lactamase [Fusarium sporotrichioides]
MATIHGICSPKFQRVRSILESYIESGEELGASITINIDDKVVVDIWGGHKDEERKEPWEEDTIVNVFSSTKTVISLAVLILVDRGMIDVHERVSKYWPEFGQNGKGDVLVRHLLSYASGVSGWEEALTVEDLYDLEKSTAMLARQAPWWTPGTASGYHALTYGHLLGELVRRVSGKSLREFVATEISGPSDADFQIGASEDTWDRITPIVPPDNTGIMPDFEAGSVQARTLLNPPVDPNCANSEGWRNAEIGAANGHGNSRSLARILSAVSLGGTIAGKRVLKEETVKLIFEEQQSGNDLVLKIPFKVGIGFGLTPCVALDWLPEGNVCFWGGWGGSFVVMDLDRRMTISYTMNKMGSGLMNPKRAIGPLDNRKTLTRCQSCAKRRIKCQGDFPCEYCVRTNKTCLPQAVPVNKVKFVRCTSFQPSSQVAGPPTHVTPGPDLTYLNYFDFFMQRCQFTKTSNNLGSDLLPLVQACAPLREVTIAIGALEASRRATVNVGRDRPPPRIVAFGSYGRSIQMLQVLLQSSDASRCEGMLWCTLLLGLFELMTQVSGDPWANHMLYGTSRILQASGMRKPSDRLGEQFFGAFNWLEANRAILYGQDTILSRGEWQNRHEPLPSPLNSRADAMFEIFVEISSFSKRFFDQIECIPEQVRTCHPRIYSLAQEGRIYQQRLQQSHNQILALEPRLDSHGNLALTLYHALDLFLCMNYTFYALWDEDGIPRLSADNIEDHVSAIISHVREILDHSNISGLLLLFPLRMAGANTVEPSQKDQILRLLRKISEKGFVVSNRIVVDLEEVWAYKDLLRVDT